jgi:hypothetical protein
MAAAGDGGVKRHQVEGEHRPSASHARRVEGEGRPADLRHPVKRQWLRHGCSAVAGCGTLPLDGAASRPVCTAWARASRWLVSRREVFPPDPPRALPVTACSYPAGMSGAPYYAEAFSPLPGGCFRMVTRQPGAGPTHCSDPRRGGAASGPGRPPPHGRGVPGSQAAPATSGSAIERCQDGQPGGAAHGDPTGSRFRPALARSSRTPGRPV